MKRITLVGLAIFILLPISFVCQDAAAGPGDVTTDHVVRWPGDDGQYGLAASVVWYWTADTTLPLDQWSVIYSPPTDSIKEGGTLDTLALVFTVPEIGTTYYIAAFAQDDAGNVGRSPIRPVYIPDDVAPTFAEFEIYLVEVKAVTP